MKQLNVANSKNQSQRNSYMCKKKRIISYIKTAIEGMEPATQMSEPIIDADDFGKNLNGMTIFRACSMSIQCVTENFTKVRNCTKSGLFKRYNTIPWNQVFGMRLLSMNIRLMKDCPYSALI